MASTTGRGVFDYIANNDNMINYNYDDAVEYDEDSSRWGVSEYLMRKDSASEEVSSHRFYTWEGNYMNRTLQVAEAVTTGELSIIFDTLDGVLVNDLLNYAVDGAAPRAMLVTAFTSATATVRNVANAITIPDNSAVHIVGNATAEDSNAAANANYVHATRVTNGLTIIRRAVEYTKTELGTDLRTARSSIADKEHQGETELKKDIAGTIWTSTIVQDTTNNISFSKGIITQIIAASAAANIDAGGDSLTFADFATALDTLMEFATDRELVAFCGSTALQNMAVLGTQATIGNVKQGDSMYGFRGQALFVGDWQIDLAFEPVFKRLAAPYNNYIVITSLNRIKLAHLKGQKFQKEAMFQENPGSERLKTQWRAQIGVKIQHAKQHALIRNLALAV